MNGKADQAPSARAGPSASLLNDNEPSQQPRPALWDHRRGHGTREQAEDPRAALRRLPACAGVLQMKLAVVYCLHHRYADDPRHGRSAKTQC